MSKLDLTAMRARCEAANMPWLPPWMFEIVSDELALLDLVEEMREALKYTLSWVPPDHMRDGEPGAKASALLAKCGEES